MDALPELFDLHPQPMLIYWIDSLQIAAVNEAQIDATGFSREELLSMTVTDLHPDEDQELAQRELLPVQQGLLRGPRRVLGLRHRRKDGRVVRIEVTARSIDYEGRPARLCLLEDVTARLDTEARAQRYGVLFDRARDAILLIANDGRLRDANAAAARLYGYTRQELLGLRILDLREPSTVGELKRQMLSASEQGLFFQTVHRRKDQSLLPVEVNSQGVELDGQRFLVSVVRDQSERQQFDEELRADEQRQLSLRLLSAIKHAAVGTLAAALSRALIAATAQGSAGAAQMQSLIGELQALAKAEQRARTRVELGEAIEGSIQLALVELSQSNPRARLLKELSPTPPVLANPERLEQLVVNLIFNAAQALPADRGGEVRVRSFVDSRERAVVEVEDNGRGIAPEQLARLFDPFFGARPGRPGLGLRLCQAIATELGGELTVDSTQGKGARFRLTLQPA